MDRRGTDADGGRVLRRGRRTRMLALVVVQNVLVTACLAVTLYVCWGAQSQTPASEDDVHIQFEPISGNPENMILKFGQVKSSYMMSLGVEERDKIYVNCTGPYVFYMKVCYLGAKEASGTLELRVVGEERPVSSFRLNASHEVCRGLHSIAYLTREDKVSLHLNSTDGFKIKNAIVGLNYLLGKRCEF
ncbi:hypothetical protein FQN60_012641 [Etheostoma spectabile]|uniref:TNF family profile domain-containing protein n=1 Tax=Etheostoma spectabile TaxID=54343 RepID=A0A5J5D9H1_9PERO|nr:hypothetical protein FQN60_012641 [Etheostoma spectabile]